MSQRPLFLNWTRIRAALRVMTIAALAALAASPHAWGQDYPQSSSEEPTYPGIPPQSKLETTIGSQQLRFYGTVLLNISASDSVEVGQEVPLWALPGPNNVTFPDGTSQRAGNTHDLIFTARQSVFGFQLKPANPSQNMWNASGTLEFDFFGARPVDTLQPQGRVLNQPRLRLGYLQVERGDWKIVAGQDRYIIAPLDPVSLSHVGIPLGATAGNLWGWQPQVRVEMKHPMGSASTLLQFGILRPQFSDPRLGDLPSAGILDSTASGFGERNTQPFYQARLSATLPMVGSTGTVGVGAHYGRERVGVNRRLDSWAFAFDYSVPLHSRVRFRGEGFLGSNLVPFQGGILQGVAAVPAAAPFTTFRKIGAGGGWAELIVKLTQDNKNVFYVGAGTDDPRDRHLLPNSTRAKNSFGWASYFHKVTDNVTAAFEWSNWDFKTDSFAGVVNVGRGPTGRGNVFNLSLAYQF